MDAAELKVCHNSDCARPARVAIRTALSQHGRRFEFQSMIYWDDRDAPATAGRYCKAHGVELLTSLGETLINDDEDEEAASDGRSEQGEAEQGDAQRRPPERQALEPGQDA